MDTRLCVQLRRMLHAAFMHEQRHAPGQQQEEEEVKSGDPPSMSLSQQPVVGSGLGSSDDSDSDSTSGSSAYSDEEADAQDSHEVRAGSPHDIVKRLR